MEAGTASKNSRVGYFVRSRGGVLIIGAVAFALLFESLRAFFPQLMDPIAMVKRLGPRTNLYVDTTHGWTVRFPSDWQAQASHSEAHMMYNVATYGVLISNIHHHFPRVHIDHGWSSGFDMRGQPARLVAALISWTYGGGFAVFPCSETRLPLSLKNGTVTRTNDGAGGSELDEIYLHFNARGSAYYSVFAYVGENASAKDRAALNALVASISFYGVPFTPRPGPGCDVP